MNKIRTIKVNNTDFTVHTYEFQGKPYVNIRADVNKNGIRQSGKLDRAKTNLTKVADMLGVYKELDQLIRAKGILLQTNGINLADPAARDIRHTPIRKVEDPEHTFAETVAALNRLAKKHKGDWVLSSNDEVVAMMKSQAKYSWGDEPGFSKTRSYAIKQHVRLEVEYALDERNINPDAPEVQKMIGEVEQYLDKFRRDLDEPWTRIVFQKPIQFLDDMDDIVNRTMPSTPSPQRYEIVGMLRGACDSILAPDGLT